MPVDIRQHLANHNYSASTQRRRLSWVVLGVLFRWSPRPCYGWRNFLLRLVGAKIGGGVRVYPDARIMFPWNLSIADHVVVGAAELYALAPIRIETNVLISQGAHLCAGSHDHQQSHFPLVLKPITVESGVWLAADCFVGPGVTVRSGAVIGARAVVMRDVDAGLVMVGNPARPTGRSESLHG